MNQPNVIAQASTVVPNPSAVGESRKASVSAYPPRRVTAGYRFLVAALLTVGITFCAPTLRAQTSQTSAAHEPRHAKSKAVRTMADSYSGSDLKSNMHQADVLEESREAGLLTDWHLEGRFGRGREGEFARVYWPEKAAAKLASASRSSQNYELVFPEGRFVLPASMASKKGVFYASSSTYLSDSGEWNVYLESGGEAVVFVDGRRVLESGPEVSGVLRGTIHAESGYHAVLVKFTAQTAPFRVAILPPNSGSRRKNNTPYLQASPASEDMMAMQTGDALRAGR